MPPQNPIPMASYTFFGLVAIEGAAGGAIAVESVTEGFEGVPEVQRVRILKPWPAVPDPRSGTWSLLQSTEPIGFFGLVTGEIRD